MNVLVVSPGLYPCITGGVEIANYFLIKELAKRGHNVWVLTSCTYNWDSRNVFLVKLNKRLLLNPTLSTLFQIFLELSKFQKLVDVIHVPYTSNSLLAYPLFMAKKLFGINYVITVHGGGMHPWKPKILQYLFFTHAKAIVAVSETLRKEYEKRSGRNIEVILPLIPLHESEIAKEELRKRHGLRDGDRVIVSVGSIKKIKGSDALLSAFLKLGKPYVEKHNLKLLYVGEGPLKSMLEMKVRERRFDKYVKFLGAFPREEVPHVYKLADIYVIPSLFEGAPLSLLEAMFNGLPIIGTDVNGINNLISDGKTGLLFAKQNSEDLTEKIRQLVDNQDLLDELGNAAKKEYLQNYGFGDELSRFIKLLQSCAFKND